MGWGDELSYLHSENVIWAGYDAYGSYTELTNTQIINACEDNGSVTDVWCSRLSFNIRGSDVGRFYEFTFKTGGYQPAGNLKVSIIGYTTEPVVLAAKTVSMTADTTYHVHIGEFS